MPRNRGMPWPRMVGLGLVMAAVSLGLCSLAEVLWWNNRPAAEYPAALIAAAPAGGLDEQRAFCGEPLEVKRLDATDALVRCGMYWPAASVWKSPRAVVDPFRVQDGK